MDDEEDTLVLDLEGTPSVLHFVGVTQAVRRSNPNTRRWFQTQGKWWATPQDAEPAFSFIEVANAAVGWNWEWNASNDDETLYAVGGVMDYSDWSAGWLILFDPATMTLSWLRGSATNHNFGAPTAYRTTSTRYKPQLLALHIAGG